VSTDYGDMERQFLATLKDDTGRALDEWMAAIASEGLAHRNDVIDWLRRQGFMFSKASWLERIHNNGGKPLYGDTSGERRSARPRSVRPAAATPLAAQPAPRIVVSNPAPQPAPQAPTPPTAPPASPALPASAGSDAGAIDAVIAKAKAYRPLAAFVIAEIRKLHPAARVEAKDGYLAFHQQRGAFAVLTVSPKELSLGLALKDRAAPAPLAPARLPAAVHAPAVTHTVALTDARQMTPALREAIRAAGVESSG